MGISKSAKKIRSAWQSSFLNWASAAAASLAESDPPRIEPAKIMIFGAAIIDLLTLSRAFLAHAFSLQTSAGILKETLPRHAHQRGVAFLIQLEFAGR